jgi:hypothetical protein
LSSYFLLRHWRRFNPDYVIKAPVSKNVYIRYSMSATRMPIRTHGLVHSSRNVSVKQT